MRGPTPIAWRHLTGRHVVELGAQQIAASTLSPPPSAPGIGNWNNDCEICVSIARPISAGASPTSRGSSLKKLSKSITKDFRPLDGSSMAGS